MMKNRITIALAIIFGAGCQPVGESVSAHFVRHSEPGLASVGPNHPGDVSDDNEGEDDSTPTVTPTASDGTDDDDNGGGLTFDAAHDFSTAGNPNGAWAYGWSASRGSAFNLATNQFTLHGNDAWDSGSTVCTPGVFRNGTPDPITFLTLTVPPGKLAFHPGANGENAVVRWTAPASGNYRIIGAFSGIDFAYPTTTDVAILLDSSELFSGEVSSYGVPLSFTLVQYVSAGESISFTVGYGTNGNYFGDSTSLDAVITEIAEDAE